MTPEAARASLMTPEAARASLMSRAPTAPGSRQPEEGRPMMERTEILSTMGALKLVAPKARGSSSRRRRAEARRAEGARKLVAPKARGSSSRRRRASRATVMAEGARPARRSWPKARVPRDGHEGRPRRDPRRRREAPARAASRVVGDLLAAELSEKQARSIKHQMTIARMPFGPRRPVSSPSRTRRSTRRGSATSPAAPSSSSSATWSWSAARAPARRISPRASSAPASATAPGGASSTSRTS